MHSWFTLVALTQEFFLRKKKIRILAGPWSDFCVTIAPTWSKRRQPLPQVLFFLWFNFYSEICWRSFHFFITSEAIGWAYAVHLNWSLDNDTRDCAMTVQTFKLSSCNLGASCLSLSTFNPLNEFLRTNTTHGFEPWDQLLSASLFLEWPGY